MLGVIIAAGNSSRLFSVNNGQPKTLLPLGNGTILSTILINLSRCGIREFCLVVGWNAESIIKYLNEKHYFGYTISIVNNEQWQRGNGLSVLAAEHIVGKDSFILSMSDHVISTSAIARIIESDNQKNLLLVDKKVDKIFDIDDATKVLCERSEILKISKNLKKYNGIDCGIFRLNNHYFKSMREQLKLGNDSISAAIDGLIKNKDMEAVFTRNDEKWIDIDTPLAYQFALKNWSD